ncbi:MAG: LysR family transcriptional regulator [Planctomycetota bacterium]
MPTAVDAVGRFFPQREALGLDPRESTPGFKRQMVILDAETRSLKRASIVMKRVVGLDVSTNTIERVALEVGNDLEAAEQERWQNILTGEVPVPSVAIVEFDGGRIRTRKTGCGPGVHLDAKGWNETKNAIFVSATSERSEVDPQPDPPTCFLDADHVAKLTEKAKTMENTGSNDSFPKEQEASEQEQPCKPQASHKPQRLLRTVIASMKNSKQFGAQMAREAKRRRFDEAPRKAYVADGLTCNWTIHAEHFHDYVAILDFTHAVSYLFTASLLCFGKTDKAWAAYLNWMTKVWRGKVGVVIAELKSHQARLGLPPEDTDEDDPREQLRRVIGYLENNEQRMRYDEYRMSGLPTTSAWMESAVKEMNYRIKGTEMFWNNPSGAEAILQIRAAALSDDDRLVRLLSHRPGQRTLRRNHPAAQAA